MSTCAEMRRQCELARPSYLELRALGLERRAGEDPQEPLDYYVEVRCGCSLSKAHAERVVERIADHKPGLIRSPMMGEWDPGYHAIREEGTAA